MIAIPLHVRHRRRQARLQPVTGTRPRTFIGILMLLMGLIVAPIAAALPAAAIGAATFTNPIEPDTADPTIEFYEGNYYMVATT